MIYIQNYGMLQIIMLFMVQLKDTLVMLHQSALVQIIQYWLLEAVILI